MGGGCKKTEFEISCGIFCFFSGHLFHVSVQRNPSTKAILKLEQKRSWTRPGLRSALGLDGTMVGM